jgi:hypothetical protein
MVRENKVLANCFSQMFSIHYYIMLVHDLLHNVFYHRYALLMEILAFISFQIYQVVSVMVNKRPFCY